MATTRGTPTSRTIPRWAKHITSETDNHGAGGHIELDVGSLAVTTEGQIRSAGTGMGDAGTIRVGASGSLNMDGGASITTSADQANAGDLIVSAAQGLYLIDSEIAARAAGDGGNIELTAGGEMRLFDGRITTRAGGTGGNITIASPFCLFDHARLSADASLGNGGNILIATDVFLESGSLITASSEFGIAGTIEITAPLVDLAGTLAPLPENLWAGEVRLADPCVTRFLRGSSSFVVGGREGLPMAPGALLPSLELPAAGPAEPQGEGGETPVTVP